MGEIPTSLPIDLSIRDSLQERLYDGLKEYGDLMDVSSSPEIGGINVNYLFWSEKARDLAVQLIEPRTFEQFSEMRSYFLSEQIRRMVTWQNDQLNHRERRGSQFNSLFTEEMFWEWMLATTGIITRGESSEYQNYFENNGFPIIDRNAGKTLTKNTTSHVNVRQLEKSVVEIQKEISVPVMSTLASEEKIMGLEAAARSIRAFISKGLRVGIVMGVWDLYHEGHGSFLEEAKHVLGKHGRLIVTVSSDEEVRIIKGVTRPIQPLDHRVNALSRLAVVDAVLPVLLEGSEETIDSIGVLYQKLLYILSPHFRLIGQREQGTEIYEKESSAAGVGILYSGLGRVTSTTTTIEEILKRYANN